MTATASIVSQCLSAFDRVIPAKVQANPLELRSARHLTLLASITALSVPILTLMYHFLGDDAAATVVLTGGIVMMISPFLMGVGLGLAVARDVFIGALFVLKIWLAVHLGGIGAPTVPWFVLCPLIAVLLGGAVAGLFWSAMVSATVIALFWLEQSGVGFAPYPVSHPLILQLVSVIGLFALVTIIALCFRSDAPSAWHASDSN
ncbi:MAG TPA: hypothetical protein VFG03_15420 [Telluria sp.]|nr:hypothetical protein [Telluria sp.]